MPKTYVATCRSATSTLTQAQEDALLTVLTLNDGPARFDAAVVKGSRTITFEEHETYEIDVEVSLRIGRNRIVRRLMAAHNLPVCKLQRIAIGGLKLASLNIPNTSDSVQLTPVEIARLWQGARDNNTNNNAADDSAGKKRAMSDVTDGSWDGGAAAAADTADADMADMADKGTRTTRVKAPRIMNEDSVKVNVHAEPVAALQSTAAAPAETAVQAVKGAAAKTEANAALN